MGRLLQAGVLLAATVVLAGGVMYLIAHTGSSADYRAFVAKPVMLRHPMALFEGVMRGHAAAVIQLGILMLVATPICRVAFAVSAFIGEKDWLYTAVGVIVLAVLLSGMLHGS